MTAETAAKTNNIGRIIGLSALSGLLLTGALPALDWGWLAWIALIPFLSLFPFRSKRAAFGGGMLLAGFYSLGMVYWVAVFAAHLIGPALSVLGWALLTLCEAAFFGAWAAGVQCLHGRSVWAWRLGVPALWAVTEWARQSGPLGLSWGDLAYTQHLALPVLQVVKLAGIWGLAFLIVLVNLALLDVFRRRRKPGAFSLGTAALTAGAIAYGLLALRAENLRPTFVAAALQGNIDQTASRNPEQDPAYTARVMQTFTQQSRLAAEHGAALVVWPEEAFPGHLLDNPTPRQQLALQARRDHQVAVVGGAEYDWNLHKNANSLFLMDSTGTITGSYQKRQLVPFGEFVPGSDWFPSLEALHVLPVHMKAGLETQPLLDGGPNIGKLGAAICFESSYPRFLREQAARGAGLLVISTDDVLFGQTSEVRQHSAIAAVRAAETDRYVVRSAATGISQIVDPTGRVVAEAEQGKEVVVLAPVESRQTLTPFVRWGDWFIGLCILILAGVSIKKSPPRSCGEGLQGEGLQTGEAAVSLDSQLLFAGGNSRAANTEREQQTE